MTGISRSSYAVDCNRTCPLAQLGPDDIARGSEAGSGVSYIRKPLFGGRRLRGID